MLAPEIRGDDQRTPIYQVAWRLPRQRRWAICVFVINEGKKIRQQLRRMKGYASSVDLIIADGGSTDGSLDAALMQEVDARALLVKTGPGRLSAQMRMAIDYCMA
jgi:dolichol-phosphate mannosyltransferase